MSNCHQEFSSFSDKILLADTKEKNLRRGRDSLREKIKGYYSEHNKKLPVFRGQGSFSMRTTIFQKDEDYDLDDGVYLLHLSENKSDWPKTEAIHEEIIEAVDGHTDIPTIDKHACIRVQYKNEYHIDLAIYCENNGKKYLARRGDEQWEENDPLLFRDWFDKKVSDYGEQFRRLCKYIKKWAYYKGYSEITGFLITILVGNNFQTGYWDRDDQALEKTLDHIVSDLAVNKRIIRPVAPYKNMTVKYSEEKFVEKFTNRFTTFQTKARAAIQESDKDRACKIWQEMFGEDFPDASGEKNEKGDAQLKVPAVIKTEMRPWGE